jgi:hypothetical protein
VLDGEAAFDRPQVGPIAAAVAAREILDLEQRLPAGVHIFDGAFGADHPDAVAAGFHDAEEVRAGAFQNGLVRSLARHQGLLAEAHVHRAAQQFKGCMYLGDEFARKRAIHAPG